MKKCWYVCLVVCLGLGLEAPLLAQQQQEPGPPPVLQIWREEVKPGQAAAHARTESGWPRAFAKANWPVHYIAMTSVTGLTEAWYLTGYPNLAAYEADRNNSDKNAALTAELNRLSTADAAHINSVRSILTAYRPEMSYRTGGNIATMRYFQVTTYRVRPGYENEFTEAWRAVVAAHERANMQERWAFFQVMSGAPAGTFLYFSAMKSLAEQDALGPMHTAPAYRDAQGDEGRRQMRDLMRSGVITSDTQIFAFDPRMSYVSKEMAAADPDFWTPKPPAPRPAAKPATQD